MQIFIKFLLDSKQCFGSVTFPRNSAKTLTLDVEPHNTLRDVKELITLQSGILVMEQKLWFAKNMDDEEATLNDLKIQKESTLLLYHSNVYPPTVISPSMLVAKAVIDKKSLSYLKQLLDAKADPNSRYAETQYPDTLPETAVHYASWFRENDAIPILTLLLERKADIHALAHPYGTPLHFASHYANTEVVKFLLEKGANPWISFFGIKSATKIKSKVSLPKDVTTCCSCLEELSPAKTQAILPCQHFFHSACLNKVKSMCPLCRKKIVKETV